MPYRRSIYIGLGGLGVQVISEVKKLFNEKVHGDETLPMIKYLGIDNNHHELQNSDLNNEEQMLLHTNIPIAHFHAHPQSFPWMPDENKKNLDALSGNCCAGQIRSNGRFAFEINKYDIRRQLLGCYNQIVQLQPGMADILYTPNIDIHVVSSIAGGTGSGIVIEFAKMVKEVIPNSNVMGYFFSGSFFLSTGISWNIEANAYATLFELNCEMSSPNRPFDTCVYIDNTTDCHNGMIEQFRLELDEAIYSTARTMCFVASCGDGYWHYFDDLKTAMTSGVYNQAQSFAWIAGIGSCAISYHADELNNYIYHVLASRFVRTLLHNPHSPQVCRHILEDIRQSYEELGNDLEAFVDSAISPTLIVVEGNGTIHAERAQNIINERCKSIEKEVYKWREKARLQISDYISDVINTTDLLIIENTLSGLSDLLNDLKHKNADMRNMLCEEIESLSHQLEAVLREFQYHCDNPVMRLIHRAELENTRGRLAVIECQMLKNEQTKILIDRTQEMLSSLLVFCAGEIEQNKAMIHIVRELDGEISSTFFDFHHAKASNMIEINLTPILISQLDSIIDKINVSWNVVWEKLLDTNSYQNISKEYFIHIISQNCVFNINYCGLLVNVDGLEHYILDMLHKSESLISLDCCGNYNMFDESLVVSTPPGLEQMIRNILVNQLHINNALVVQDTGDEIRAYKVAYLFTPWLLHGMSESEYRFRSNECSVVEELKLGRYSPFTDKYYQNLFCLNCEC